MALSIRNAETERLARELARRRGIGVAEAITHALRKEVERERRKPRPPSYGELKARIDAIVEDVKRLLILDDRSDDEILGYNENGLFD